MKAPKRMASGRYVDLANFKVEDVDLWDINRSLNTQFRFTGHWKDKKPLTVAQHTLLVMHFAERIFPGESAVLFDCLLHDMPEAYYGDVATPWKRIVGDPLRKAQQDIDDKVYSKLWKIPESFDEEVESKRKLCDLLALDVERRNIWKSQVGKDNWPKVPEEGVPSLSLGDKQDLFDELQARDFVDLEEIYTVDFKIG